ncbi:MAG: hypothetical protein U9O94_05585, partial [Nanoarchaeota archaeon]|nr:hypothetical protein [Nanoarchaeota archaeon]
MSRDRNKKKGELFEVNKKPNNHHYGILTLLLVLMSMGLLVFMQPEYLGFTVGISNYNYSDDVNLVVDNNHEYTWFMDNVGKLRSVRLDGCITKDAVAKVYLEYNNEKYLVFDSAEIVSGEIESINNNSLNQSINNQSLENNSIINETNNESIEKNSINKSIKITTQGGGSKAAEDIFEFNILDEFSWDVDYSKVCTKWDVNSISMCYGAGDCCALIGLESLGNWDDSFYLSYG